MSTTEATNNERERARQIIEFTSTHLFLTGKAGTGKTTFLRQLKADAPKRMIVLAPTGIAAINAGGSTIHSFFQLPFAPFIPEENYQSMNFKLRKKKIQLIRSLDLIVIDEISMVRADLLDQIDAVLRQYRNHYEPFGGVQLLMIGDLQQLSPVAKEEEWKLLSKYYDSPYFFSSHALKQTQYVTVELQTVYRQSDPEFLNLLNSIRENKADTQVLARLNQRYLPNFQPNENESYIRLVTHNWQAEHINEGELSKIKERTYTFDAKIEGTFPEYSYPTEAKLSLKLGAQVMFVKNDLEKRYYNGTLGEIIAINENSCTVRTADRNFDVTLEQEEWLNTRYVLNEKSNQIEELVEGSFHQLPVKLAWAITIHKSQGLTFERAIIDAHSAFAHGQTYVALSRCKTLEGMVLSSPIPASAIIQDKAVCNFNAQIEQQQPTTNNINQLKNQHYLKLISDLFDFSPIKHSLYATIRLMEESFYQLFPETLKRYKDFYPVFNDKVLVVAEKFRTQYQRLISNNTNDDISPEIQDRLQKGANYFSNELSTLLNMVDKTILTSDNKEIKKRTTNILDEFNNNLRQKCQLLAYVSTKGFDVIEFQKYRALLAAGKTITPEGNIADAPQSENSRPKEKLVVPSEIQHPDLYRELHNWRNQKAKEEKVPVYLIIQSKALLGISNLLPMDLRTLSLIPYFGAKSMENYGEEILEIIHKYVKDKNLQSKQPTLFDSPQPSKQSPAEEKPEEKKSKEPSAMISLRLYKKLKNVDAVAQERGLAPTTIYSHLIQCIQDKNLKSEDLVSADKINTIRKYIESQPHPETLKLSDIRNAIGEKYSYQEINAVMANFRK